MTRFAISMLVVAALMTAAAGTNDQSDTPLCRPNWARPAIVTPGQAFDVVAALEMTLRIASGDVVRTLDAEWREGRDGAWSARFTVPLDTPPGVYAIEAAGAEGVARNPRSVFVCESFPETYTFAHLDSLEVGANSQLGLLDAAIDQINAADIAFVLVTGPLTAHGRPEELERARAALERCQKPTFVCAGKGMDASTGGPSGASREPYAFRFGDDGYMTFDTSDACGADVLGNQAGDIQRLRRALKSCRWTIGYTQRYGARIEEPDIPLRSQLIIFVDDPVDLLVCGCGAHMPPAQPIDVPWGSTRLVCSPPAANGAYRLIDVTSTAIVPRPPVVATAK